MKLILVTVITQHVFCCRLEQAQTAQRMVADDKEDLERQLQDIGHAKVCCIQSCCEYKYCVSCTLKPAISALVLCCSLVYFADQCDMMLNCSVSVILQLLYFLFVFNGSHHIINMT